MTGRTNVVDGVSINATTANKVIADGYSIVAGDFVEYYTEAGVIDQQSANNMVVGNIGDYSITLGGTYNGYGYSEVKLFKNDALIDVYDDYSIYNAIVFGDYVIFATYNNPKIIGTLKIQSEALVLVDSITIPSATYRKMLCVANNKVFVTTDDASKPLTVCDISAAGLLSNMKETSNLGNATSIFYDNSTYYYVFKPTNKVSSIYTLTIASDNSVTRSYSPVASITLPENSSALSNIIYQDDGIVIFGYTGYLTKIILPELTYTNISINGTPFSLIEDDMFVSYGTAGNQYNVYLYSIDVALNTTELIDRCNIGFAPYPGYSYPNGYNGIGWKNGDRVSVFRSNSGYFIYLYEVIDDLHIEPIADTDYVVPFSVENHPIGVAKDSGIAGDTIAVYIPQSAI